MAPGGPIERAPEDNQMNTDKSAVVTTGRRPITIEETKISLKTTEGKDGGRAKQSFKSRTGLIEITIINQGNKGETEGTDDGGHPGSSTSI